MSQLADNFESQVGNLRNNKTSAEDALNNRISQGPGLMQTVIFALVRGLVQDDALTPKFSLVKDRARNQWNFEITFPEGQMINRPDVQEALTDIERIHTAGGYPESENPVMEK